MSELSVDPFEPTAGPIQAMRMQPSLANPVPQPHTDPMPAEAHQAAPVPKPAIPDGLLQQTAKHLRSIGTVNILVAGQTGVGKSTLINNVLGRQVAPTASGRPVTQHAEWYMSDAVPLRLMDTRGLEAKEYGFTLRAMRSEIEQSRAERSERDQLHLAWVCIAAPSSRVQDCEVDIVRLLNLYDTPAIVVLTKDDGDDGGYGEFAETVSQVLANRRAEVFGVVRVGALAKARRPSVGLGHLCDATFATLPEAHRNAFAAAQRVNRGLSRALAANYVAVAAAAAALASMTPVPSAATVALAAIQGTMLAGICKAFGLAPGRGQVLHLASMLLGCMGVVLACGWAVGNVLTVIPGPDAVTGAALNGAIAGTVTWMLGRTCIRLLHAFTEAHGRMPRSDEALTLLPPPPRAE